MNNITDYIFEKLKIDKDSKVFDTVLNYNTKEYNGIRFGIQHANTVYDFDHRDPPFYLKQAYKMVQYIIDNFINDFKGCYFELYGSGNRGFSIFNAKYSNEKYDKLKKNVSSWKEARNYQDEHWIANISFAYQPTIKFAYKNLDFGEKIEKFIEDNMNIFEDIRKNKYQKDN